GFSRLWRNNIQTSESVAATLGNSAPNGLWRRRAAAFPPLMSRSAPNAKFLPGAKLSSLPARAGSGNSCISEWQLFCSAFGQMLDGLSNRIERYLDVLSTRQKLVAGNIANADTPGYHTRDLDFQSEFQHQLRGLSPVVHEVSGLAVKADGN